MSQFLARPEDIDAFNLKAHLVGDEAHHLARVMRVPLGARVKIFDSRGSRWEGVFVHFKDGEAHLSELTPLPSNEPLYPARLVQGLLKGDRWEWLLEKAVELGVHTITPVLSKRVVVRPKISQYSKLVERWNKIALAAAKQCERAIVPTVEPPIDLRGFFQGLPLEKEPQSRLVFLERADAGLPAAQDKPSLLAIGPEGGWTSDEGDLFTTNGFVPTGLGPRILRGETAALAALALTVR